MRTFLVLSAEKVAVELAQKGIAVLFGAVG
jgi:hypothetical protein